MKPILALSTWCEWLVGANRQGEVVDGHTSENILPATDGILAVTQTASGLLLLHINSFHHWYPT